MVDRAVDAHRDAPQPAAGLRIGEQVVCQQRMQVQNGVTIETDFVGLLDEHFDGRLVVQDHLRFQRILSLGGLAQFEQALGFEQRIGIAFQATGVPGKVNQQTAVDRACVGPGRTFAVGRAAHFEQALTRVLRQVVGLVGPVVIQKGTLVADWLPVLNWRANRLLDRHRLGRNRRIDLDTGRMPFDVELTGPCFDGNGVGRQAIAATFASPLCRQSFLIDQQGQAPLQHPRRQLIRQPLADGPDLDSPR